MKARKSTKSLRKIIPVRAESFLDYIITYVPEEDRYFAYMGALEMERKGVIQRSTELFNDEDIHKIVINNINRTVRHAKSLEAAKEQRGGLTGRNGKSRWHDNENDLPTEINGSIPKTQSNFNRRCAEYIHDGFSKEYKPSQEYKIRASEPFMKNFVDHREPWEILIKQESPSPSFPMPYEFCEDENKVAHLLCRGLNQKNIATSFGVSTSLIGKAIRSMRIKLAESDLPKWAMRRFDITTETKMQRTKRLKSIAYKLRKENGLSLKQITQITGLSHGTVQACTKNIELTNEQKDKIASGDKFGTSLELTAEMIMA